MMILDEISHERRLARDVGVVHAMLYTGIDEGPAIERKWASRGQNHSSLAAHLSQSCSVITRCN